ncbi:TetR family transcriptional regulator [Sphingorhabdus sp. Alg231-15]|uniref:TetR family transcriptional regulator n=1 Tax=Sphingorhabdus sp. Alg231-15 TaxID=1922222 RepID=UPI000D556FE9
MPNLKPKRGRPVTIDTQTAMQAVVELFRSKGFAAVSLDDLSDATGLSRPSLYRAFGNKHSMYISAMDAFGTDVMETAVPALHATDDLESALTDFYAAMLSIYYRDSRVAPGCLVFGTAPSSADDAEIKSRLEFGIEQLDELMRARISKSAPNSSASQIDTAVNLASNTLVAFSARAKSGARKRDLVVIGAQTARSITSLLKLDHSKDLVRRVR